MELTKQVFLDCNRALSEFENADPEKKQKIAENLLWNFEVKDKKAFNYQYKTPYQILANAPKNDDLLSKLPD